MPATFAQVNIKLFVMEYQDRESYYYVIWD
jgi:hypothetical protein